MVIKAETLWAALETTYSGMDIEENWQAMFRALDLFQKVAIEVGEHLGFRYPQALHDRSVAYLQRVQNLDKNTGAS